MKEAGAVETNPKSEGVGNVLALVHLVLWICC